MLHPIRDFMGFDHSPDRFRAHPYTGRLKLKQLGEGGTQLLDKDMIMDCAGIKDAITLQNHDKFDKPHSPFTPLPAPTTGFPLATLVAFRRSRGADWRKLRRLVHPLVIGVIKQHRQ